MNKLIWMVLIIINVLLVACVRVNVGPAAPGCVAVCQAKAAACENLCRNNCPQCIAFSEQKASESYLYYQHEEYVKGGFIARDLQAYRDPLQCRKTTCSCKADYNICLQACGGIIHKQLRPAAVCQ